MILGLTGGIGSGKSTVSKIFLSIGIKIFDADIIAKNILMLDDTKYEIKKQFGEKVFIKNTTEIDKQLLKKEIFNNSEKLSILNNIIHPKVINEYKNIYIDFSNKKELIVFDVPLLFESGIDKLCDKILTIDISKDLQFERIKKRDNITDDLIEKIVSKQMTKTERNNKSDFVIKNNGTFIELEEKILELIKNISNYEERVE